MKPPPTSKGAFLPLINKGWIGVSKRGILFFPYRLGRKFVNALWRVFWNCLKCQIRRRLRLIRAHLAELIRR
jgi:hypothetical protein